MFFGVTMSPMGWFLTLLGAFFAMFIPVFIIGGIAESFPSPLSDIIFLILFVVAWPAILCWLYSRKIFAQGRASVFFWFYLIFYIGFGALILFKSGTVTLSDGSQIVNEISILDRLGGLLMIVVGIVMFVWSRNEKKKFNIAVVDTMHAEREDQINAQAEAILRAEEMKKERGL